MAERDDIRHWQDLIGIAAGYTPARGVSSASIGRQVIGSPRLSADGRISRCSRRLLTARSSVAAPGSNRTKGKFSRGEFEGGRPLPKRSAITSGGPRLGRRPSRRQIRQGAKTLLKFFVTGDHLLNVWLIAFAARGRHRPRRPAAAGQGQPYDRPQRQHGQHGPLQPYDPVFLNSADCVRSVATEAMAKNEPRASHQRGVIINTASISGFDEQPGQVPYGGAKGGNIAMALNLARDLAPLGIRSMAVAPRHRPDLRLRAHGRARRVRDAGAACGRERLPQRDDDPPRRGPAVLTIFQCGGVGSSLPPPSLLQIWPLSWPSPGIWPAPGARRAMRTSAWGKGAGRRWWMRPIQCLDRRAAARFNMSMASARRLGGLPPSPAARRCW